MNSEVCASGLDRRDWLKAATWGGSASLLAAGRVIAEAPEPIREPAKKVRGVVFMVSDGMSAGVLTMAEAFSKLKRGKGTRWWSLIGGQSTSRGLMDTASANSLVTDSAAASSAWGGGQRVHNGVINIAPSGRELTPIAELLKKSRQARIGLVTTATVTHATPAGFAAVSRSRADEPSIAAQYLDRVDVILGGGSVFFDKEKRTDKRDLAGEFGSAGYELVRTSDQLKAARGERLLGLFTSGHLPFEIDRTNHPETAARVPSLEEMAKAALSRFLDAKSPFLLQVEGARIDHAAHLNDIAGVLGDQLAFDDALAAVLEMTAGHDDVLVVVTSDHGNANPGLNGMGRSYADSDRCFATIARHSASHERIFAEWAKSGKADDEAITRLVARHLGFQLAKSEADAMLRIFNKEKVGEWNHQLSNPEGLLGQIAGNHTGIGWTGTTHTSDPTPVSAVGPQSDRFSGIVTNTDVFAHLVELLG